MTKQKSTSKITPAVEGASADLDKIKDTPEPISAKKSVVKNLHSAHHKVYGVFVPPGAIYEITERDMDDKVGTIRLENAIKKGKLERK